jgi:hypothetical protein
MNCQPCATDGHDQAAVGLCPSCSAGLCLEHRIEQEHYVGPGGRATHAAIEPHSERAVVDVASSDASALPDDVPPARGRPTQK